MDICEIQTRTIVVCLLTMLGFSIFSVDYANIIYASKNNNSPSSELRAVRIPDFSFVAAGDFGCTPEANRTITNMVNKNPDLMLALGDLSYEKDGTCWFKLVSPLDTPGKIRITIGDHDVDPDLSRYKEYLDHFNLTKPYYSFDYQNVHFLAMTTGKVKVIPFGNPSEQYRFIEQDLKNAHDNETIDWIIVFGFKPLYSSNSTHRGSAQLRDTYHPLFDRYDVHLVLQAHNHNYERTFPLTYNDNGPSKPKVVDKQANEYDDDPKGPILVTVGTGGRNLHELTGKSHYVAEQFLKYGFLDVNITGDGSNLTATFYENTGEKAYDRFTIIKDKKSENN